MASSRRLHDGLTRTSSNRLDRAPGRSRANGRFQHRLKHHRAAGLQGRAVALDVELAAVLGITAGGGGILPHLHLQRHLRARRERALDDGVVIRISGR